MIEPQWLAVAELIQPSQTSIHVPLMERLALAVRELHVPMSVSERLQQVVTAALARAFQIDGMRAAGVKVLTHATQLAGEPSARSWGFFLVERGIADGALFQIEVFLYPDGG